MTIPASHELGLGSDRNEDRGRGIDADMGRTEPYSRNYLHVIDDVARIHRLLRPMKAKVAAIQLAIKSTPPLSHLCKEAPIESDDDDSPTPPRSRTWEKSVAKKQSAQRRALNTGSSSTKSISAASSTETLVKKYGPSLKSLFQEAIEKVWWRPFCEDYHLPPNTTPAAALGQGIAPGRNTLGRACAFKVGRIVANLQEDDLPIMEKHYNIMPSHMRRFAVLQHITELCVLYIPVALLIQPLVAVCVQYRADYQALSLLQHMFECQDTDFHLNYVWAYSATQQLGCSDEWIRYLSQKLGTNHLYSKSFRDILTVIRPEHRARMVKAAFDVLMDQAEPLTAKRIWRPKVLSWATQLIEDSLSVHQKALESEGESCASVCDEVMEHIAQRIYACATAKGGATVAVWNSLRDLGVGLALHSLYVAVTGSAPLDENEKVEQWISLLRVHDERNTLRADFDVVFKAYGLLTNLNALALMLDAVGLYNLSMRLLQEMISNYRELSSKTKEQLGYVCDVTLSGLRRHLEEVRQRKEETYSREEWYYDDVLDEWVERGPTTDRIQRTLERSSGEEDEQHVASPSAKSRRSVDVDEWDFTSDYDCLSDILSDISFDSLAENSRTPPRRKRPTGLRISPFVLRSPIHFSMTPMKRPNLPVPQAAPSYVELDDLDYYQNIAQDDDEYVADDLDQEEQLDEFEVGFTQISEVMDDSDADADAYVESGSVSSDSVSSLVSARSKSSHTTEFKSDVSFTEESTQRVMDTPGSDSDGYVDTSEQRKSNPVHRERKLSPGPQYSRAILPRSESKSSSPTSHVEQENGRNDGIFLDSSLDTTPQSCRFRVIRFSRRTNSCHDKSPLRRNTTKKHPQVSTDSESASDAPVSLHLRSPIHVTSKKSIASVPYVEIPCRKYNRKLSSDPSPSFDKEYEPFAKPPYFLRNGRPSRPPVPSLLEIPDTDTEQSDENSAGEMKPKSRQTNTRKHATRSSSPMHRTLNASSLTRPRTTSAVMRRSSVPNKTASSVRNTSHVHSRIPISTHSPLSAKTPTTRAANKPVRTSRRKRRTISTILDSDFSDSGDSEYTVSDGRTKRRSVKPSVSTVGPVANPVSRSEIRKRRSFSYGDERNEEEQSDEDEDDEDEFVYPRKKHARSARLS